MEEITAIILAAGKKETMNSDTSNLLHKVYGKEIISRVVETVKKAGIDTTGMVVGYQEEQVQAIIKDKVTYIEQGEVLGTGHAVIKAIPFLQGKTGKVLILSGDIPILRPETLQELVQKSIENKDSVTILTAIYQNPNGYGRIIRDDHKEVIEIVEEENLRQDQHNVTEINSGIYCFDCKDLLECVQALSNDNLENEYRLPDVIKIMKNKDKKIGTVLAQDHTEILGVHDRIQLEMITRILKVRINSEHMRNGVTIEDITNTYIYDNVIIGKDTIIHPNTTIKSDVEMGEECEIGPNAYIREGCRLANKVKIGSFVEIKKAIIGEGSKVPHLSYMGDCEIGEKCNIGCGTITCNYDGFHKSKTIIGSHTFIGSNTNLVAPVTLGDNTFIAAGSTITEDVPSGALAIARQRQTNKEGWNKKD